MIVSSANIEAGAHLKADLAIIGAGAAGITIAKRLAGTKYSVIVLESGGETFDAASQAFYKGSVVGQRIEPLDTTRLRYFGGTTNHWSGWCRPLEPTDFNPRADWPESGWPIGRADLDPYYKEAAALCQLGPYEFDNLAYWQGQPGGKALKPLALDASQFQTAIFQISTPTHFGDAYGAELMAAKNVIVLLDASTLELLPSPASRPEQARKSIGSLQAVGKGAANFTVSARAFVVAAGGIESARLMLLSDKVNKAGAGNETDLVGRYFMEHPWMANSAYLRFASDNVQAPLYFDKLSVAGARVLGTISASPALLEREKIGGFRLVLDATRVSTAGADAIREIVGQLQHGAIPNHLGEDLSNVFADFDVLADSAYKTVTGSRKGWIANDNTGPYKGAWIDLNFEQRPNRDSRVLLDNVVDARGQRRVSLDWRLTDTDRRTATRALELAAAEFGRMGLGRARIRLDVANGKPWPAELTGSCHHMGTLRMSESPAQGVVDADCRVHSTDNLFVAGSAVFPTSGYANPTLTIVALASRLAEHLQHVVLA